MYCYVVVYLLTHICTHTYIHTYIHTHIHTYTHTYIHTHTHIHTYIHTYSPNLYAYFPFGLGYRSCIGRHLAMVKTNHFIVLKCVKLLLQIEAKVLLVKLLQAFTITLPNGYKPGVAVRSSIQPKDKIPVIVELRK